MREFNQLFNDIDLSEAYTSPVMQCVHMSNASIVAEWVDGTDLSGELTFEVSNNPFYPDRRLTGDGTGNWALNPTATWVTLEALDTAVTGSDNALIEINDMSFQGLRIVYTPTDGTGTGSIQVQLRGVGQ